MDKSLPTSWWKLMLCGASLAFFNIFAHAHLDRASVWGPVRSLYRSYGPDRVLAVITGVAVLFLLAALVEKVRARSEDFEEFERPVRPQEPRDAGKYRWVDVD